MALRTLAALCFIIGLSACHRHFDPKKTFSIEQIRADHELMRSALQEAHPGIYRYTSPDSIKWIFDQTALKLDHPMTEREFRRTVNPIFSFIRCGHTDVYSSKEYIRYIKKHKPKDFPIIPYFLQNNLQVFQNNSSDSTLKVGDEIISIDNRPTAQIIQDMRSLIPSDGYNQTYKYSVINGGFGSFYRYLYGNSDTISVTIKDSATVRRTLKLTLKQPTKAAAKAAPKLASVSPATPPPPTPKSEKIDKRRNLTFSKKDSSVAILDINTFSDNGYKRFYKKSFKAIKQKNIKHLVIDLRVNGGGKSDASITLMSYLLDSAYVVYDSVEAVKSKPSFNKYYGRKFHRFLSYRLWSKKLPTGNWRSNATGKTHKPNQKYAYKGQVYLLTNGGSFSAAAIFPSIVQQYCPKAVVIGRETGGGRHGCNAFISPYLTLPNTRAKVRIPMYKIVLRIPGRDQGHGVIPNIPVQYTFDDVRKGRDLDIDKVYELAKKHQSQP